MEWQELLNTEVGRGASSCTVRPRRGKAQPLGCEVDARCACVTNGLIAIVGEIGAERARVRFDALAGLGSLLCRRKRESRILPLHTRNIRLRGR